MPTWNSRGLRGSTFEDLLNRTNEKYAQNPLDFWKLWISTGSKAPVSYINAWLMTSYGFWYPDTVIDVYEGNIVYTFTYPLFMMTYIPISIAALFGKVEWKPIQHRVAKTLDEVR